MYDIFSDDYDRFVNWDSRLAFELPLIEKNLNVIRQSQTGPIHVLDAACGTGMHIIELAKRDYVAAGADFSSGMINKGRTNAKSAGVNVHLEVAGFGEMAGVFGEGKMDALLCLGNSLPHILGLPDLESALTDFTKCLRSGGLVLIQNRNFDGLILEKQRWMEPQSYHEGDDEWIFVRFYDYEPDGLINFNVMTLKRESKGPWKQRVVSSRMRPLLYSDLIYALQKAGLGEIQAFGSMQGEDFDSKTSGNLVITACKI